MLLMLPDGKLDSERNEQLLQFCVKVFGQQL
jgi:hypothetical protein